MYYANEGIDMVTFSYKISIMIRTKLTMTDCAASNNSYIITINNSTNNNMHFCLRL